MKKYLLNIRQNHEKILLIILITLFVPVKGMCTEQMIKVEFKPIGFEYKIPVTIKTICINNYEYVLAVQHNGLAITQVMEIIYNNKTVPKKCKK